MCLSLRPVVIAVIGYQESATPVGIGPFAEVVGDREALTRGSVVGSRLCGRVRDLVLLVQAPGLVLLLTRSCVVALFLLAWSG